MHISQKQLLICSLLGLLFLTSCSVGLEPTKIGIILPLSGEVALFGEASKNAVEMALSETSEATRSKINVFYEDDQFQPVKTVSAFQKLSSLNDVDVMITFTSGPSQAVAHLAEEQNMPMIASTTGADSVVENKTWVTKHWVTPQQLAKTVVPEVEQKYTRIAAVWALEEGIIAIKNAFYEELTSQDIVILDEEVEQDEKDFRTIILHIQEEQAEAILVRLLPGQTSAFFKQAVELGYEGEFFGFETFENSAEVEASGGTMVGAWYVNSISPQSDFVEKYEERFGIAPYLGAANTYDIMNILLTTVEEMTSDMNEVQKRAYINNKFHTLNEYNGAVGTYSSDGNNGFTIPAVLKIVTEEGFELYTPLS